MGLSPLYRFRDKRRFQSKIAKKISTPCILSPCWMGPLELGTGARGQKNRMMVLPGRERSLTISSAIWIQSTNMTDGRTDGQTAADSKDRACAWRCSVKTKHVIATANRSRVSIRVTNFFARAEGMVDHVIVFLSSSLFTIQNLDRPLFLLYHMCANRVGLWSQLILNWSAWLTPYKHAPPRRCYHVQFGRSGSNFASIRIYTEIR